MTKLIKTVNSGLRGYQDIGKIIAVGDSYTGCSSTASSIYTVMIIILNSDSQEQH